MWMVIIQPTLTALELKIFNKFIGNKNIIANIYSIKACHLIVMCGYFCIGLIDFMLKDKILLDYTNSLSPDEYEKIDKRILKYFC